MPSATDRPADNQPYVFVSYASADRERIMPLVGAMERAGVAVWIDREGIHGGANYAAEIDDAIERCAAFVLMASAAALASRNVKQELALGWRYERPYLPLLLEAVAIPKEVRYWLEASQWTEVLDRPEQQWLPQVLTALAPLGVMPLPEPHDAVKLAGRERELALLREKLAAAKHGRGGLVLIGGEAGIGKTTLAEAMCREATQHGAMILIGRCFDLAETPPYGPWIDLSARYPANLSLPALPPAFAERGTVGAVPSQMALFVQVQDFLTALAARQSVVLLLDDLHWADPASLDLLRFLTPTLATLPLLILATYRSDELTRRHPLYQLLPQLARDSAVARLDLSRLTDDAVRILVTQRYGLADGDAARLTAYLQGRAEGNALFVGELLRALEEAGTLRREGEIWRLGDLTTTAVPALLRQVIDGRVARLDGESQRLLSVAAVIGQEVPLAVWATVGEVDEDAMLDVVEQGLVARLLVEVAGDERVRFAHALIREAVYEGIPGIRRRRIHRRAGEVLAETGDPDPDAVAYHFQRAVDDRAAGWLVTAGERAQRAYAWLTAAERYDAALALMGDGADVGERGWLLLRIAICRRYARPDQVLSYLDEATAAAQAVGDAMLLARTRLYRGLAHNYRGDLRRGIAEMRAGVEALEVLAEAGQPYTPLDAADATNGPGTLALWLANAGYLAEARALGEAHLSGASPLLEGAGAAPYADAYFAIGMVHALGGRPDEARAQFLRAATVNREIGHRHVVLLALLSAFHYVRLPYEADRVGDRTRDAEELGVAVEGLDAMSMRQPPEFTQTDLLMLEGRWAKIHDIAAHITQASVLLIVETTQGLLAHAQGDAATASALVGRWLPEGAATEPGGTFFAPAIALIRVAAACALDTDDSRRAREWLDAHDRWLDWSGAILGQSEGQALWAQYHRQAGDDQQAYEHAERALAHATEPRQPLALLAAHRLLGELDTEAGRNEGAAAHLDASVALADACHAPYERALTLLAMAELRAATGDTTLARTFLNEVRAICDPLGAKPALARAAALAARLEAR